VHTRDLPPEVLNTWCWIHSTYTVPSSYSKKVGVEVPYPGVDNTRGYKEKKVHKFYQWVAFCLFFQVIGIEINIIFELFGGVIWYEKIILTRRKVLAGVR
jgi:hypothetical protein